MLDILSTQLAEIKNALNTMNIPFQYEILGKSNISSDVDLETSSKLKEVDNNVLYSGYYQIGEQTHPIALIHQHVANYEMQMVDMLETYYETKHKIGEEDINVLVCKDQQFSIDELDKFKQYVMKQAAEFAFLKQYNPKATIRKVLRNKSS